MKLHYILHHPQPELIRTVVETHLSKHGLYPKNQNETAGVWINRHHWVDSWCSNPLKWNTTLHLITQPDGLHLHIDTNTTEKLTHQAAPLVWKALVSQIEQQLRQPRSSTNPLDKAQTQARSLFWQHVAILLLAISTGLLLSTWLHKTFQLKIIGYVFVYIIPHLAVKLMKRRVLE